ncbi:hypothetical protein DICVIV_12663 [Dictyocaulus viviparus]|uniref:VWFA domain-containing protein n=1 Tax=Dictyocaulus viviparus TaxID=29172 RepID=A0A0D8XC73_DICVI|nr:hypothetical protein DICVIV_12663 [Dictyocaulus viviparus]
MNIRLFRIMCLILLTVVCFASAQYTSQTYPDPRIDPIACHLPLSSQICDPSSVLSDENRVKLMQKLNQFRSLTAGIRNQSPACVMQPEKNLDEPKSNDFVTQLSLSSLVRIFVIIIDKIGSIPDTPVDIEKFANNLKRRFQNYQDVSSCDTTVVIVNSKQDRQVFTVAGRDARIPKEMLKNAFERNIGFFKAGDYAMGLEGMIEILVATYSNAHIMQTSTADRTNEEVTIPVGFRPAPETLAPFRAAGLPNSVQPVKAFQSINVDDINEDDKIWVKIMQQAVARCGSQQQTLALHVRAIVEEAMSLSLMLISDSNYNSIEEEVESHKDVVGIRERAWESATTRFLQPIFQKYQATILGSTQLACPAINLKHFRRR